MSEEQLKAFIAKVQADPSLQEQLKAEGADVVAIAKAAGFSITTEDLNSHELSDDELEGAAGGWISVAPHSGPNYCSISDCVCAAPGTPPNTCLMSW